MSYIQDGIREWVWWAGQERADEEYLLSDYDTWEKNPHYRGKSGLHPEDPRNYEVDTFQDGTPIMEDSYAGIKAHGRAVA